MEQHDDFARLARLESSVEKLLAGYNALKRQKEALEARLADREAEIQRLRQTIDGMQDEKKTVHQRVSGLLSSIERWEEEQAGEEAQDEAVAGEAGGRSDGPQLSMMALDG